MGNFKVTKSEINGIYIIEPTVYTDNRGYFMEVYNENDFKDIGLNLKFVQENQSKSVKGVLRGMHYQKQFPQGKLLRVVKGKIFDVVIDIRKESRTFLKWFGIELSDVNKIQVYIEPGFAHGFLVLSDVAEINYKCTEFYHPEDECGILWNDARININWPLDISRNDGLVTLSDGTPLILSDKDKRWGKYIG